MNSRYIPTQLLRKTRRGVILLLVLGLMTMFALLTLTFMVVTSQSYRAASSGVRTGMTIDYKDRAIGAQDTWDSLVELLRGSSYSAIGNHSILENLYGHPVQNNVDYLKFKITDAKFIKDPASPNGSSIGLTPAARILYAPKGTVDNLGNTDLTTQLICLTIVPEDASITINDLPEIADMMGNVLVITHFTNSQRPETKPFRIVKKQARLSAGANDILVFVSPTEVIDNIVTLQPSTSPQDNSLCTVNGAPFSGTGIGYDLSKRPWEAALSVTDGDIGDLPLALRPNGRAPNADGSNNYALWLDNAHVQMNVDYTAPDVNNMFLAWYDMRWNGGRNLTVNADGTTGNGYSGFPSGNGDWAPVRIIPSFMRPSLMPYLVESRVWRRSWGDSYGVELTTEQRKDLIRKMVLRPLPFDHPNFTGSNPYWDFSDTTNWTANAPGKTKSDNPVFTDWRGTLTELIWLCAGLKRDGDTPDEGESLYDVDNDGDGIKEGVWIDAGLPVRVSTTGQMYKPLVSFTVLDLDGRVNVNVHGNRAQHSATSNADLGNNNGYYAMPTFVNKLGKVATDYLARGNGSGPASVRLAYALDAILGNPRGLGVASPITPPSGELVFWRLMCGYGAPSDPVNPNMHAVYQLPGRYGFDNSAKAGLDGEAGGVLDFWANYYGFFDPHDGQLVSNPYNVGGVAPDYWDVASVALDVFGQRIIWPSLTNGANWLSVLANNPYRFNTFHDSSVDSSKLVGNEVPDMRFTPSELEDLLRQSDVDQAHLPKRLRRLLMNDPSNMESTRLDIRSRHFLTTMSNDIPLPNPRFGKNPGVYTLLYHCVEDQVIRLGVREGYLNLANADYATAFAAGGLSNAKALLRSDLAPVVMPLVDKLMDMLPEQIRNGEKLDLNLLTQTGAWNNFDVPIIIGDGSTTIESTNHLNGLRERADLARGIYILLMAMSYEQLYGVDDLLFFSGGLQLSSTQSTDRAGYSYADPYFEPSLAQEERLDWPNETNPQKRLEAMELARQVMASRLAQYAVNLIDYADPDATMTPMIFDVDPFAIVFHRNTPRVGDIQVGVGNPGNRPAISNDISMSGYLSCWVDLRTNITGTTPPINPPTFTSNNPNDWYAGFGSMIGPCYNNNWTPAALQTYLGTSVYDANYAVPDVRMPFATNNTTTMSRIRLIRGMERSDLALTESLATHDLGIADTDADTARKASGHTSGERLSGENGSPDPHFDQVKMPEASAWFELYCTTDGNQPSRSRDLYSYNNGVFYLDLEKQAPPSVGGDWYPVWHLAISESTNPLDAPDSKSKGKPENSIALRLADRARQPMTFTLQTRQPELNNSSLPVPSPTFYGSLLGPTDPKKVDDVAIDRIVWFGSWNPEHNASFPNWRQIFWNRGSGNQSLGGTSHTQLLPNDYLIVAPRMTTFLGSLRKSAVPDSVYGFPTGEGIDLREFLPPRPGGAMPDYTDNPLFSGVRKPKVIVAAAQPPAAWDIANLPETANLGVGIKNVVYEWQLGMGINVSAPLPRGTAYYTEPRMMSPDETTPLPNRNSVEGGRYTGNWGYYRIYSKEVKTEGENMWFEMVPATTASYAMNLCKVKIPDNTVGYEDIPYDLDSKYSSPIYEDELFGVGTIPMYRSVMLQRLADPNLPYDPILNPYVTVDWNMIDLTVFTGEEDLNDTDFPNGMPGDQIADARNSHGGSTNDVDKDVAPGTDDIYPQPNRTGGRKPDGDRWDLRPRLSSRQWGRTALPVQLRDTIGIAPNPWGRIIDPMWVVEEDAAGTNKIVNDSRQLDPSILIASSGVAHENSPNLTDFNTKLNSGDTGKMNFPHRPQHSLGRLNWMYSVIDPSTISTNRRDLVDGQFMDELINKTDGVNLQERHFRTCIPPNVFRGGYSVQGDNIGRIVLPDPGISNSLLLGAPLIVTYAPEASPTPASFDVSTYRPFTNLSWNNSPYSNPYEAMSVPASSPGRFGLEFVDRNKEDFQLFDPVARPPYVYGTQSEPDRRNPFNLVLVNRVGVAGAVPPLAERVGSLGSGGRFGYPLVNPAAGTLPVDYKVDGVTPMNLFQQSGQGHLLNFFHSSPNAANFERSSGGVDAGPRNLSMNFGAILDHLQVPSRFYGTKEWLSNTPYGIPTYREPGKINVNTMTEPAWHALMNDRQLPQASTNQKDPLLLKWNDADMPLIPNTTITATAIPNTDYYAFHFSRLLGSPNPWNDLKLNAINNTTHTSPYPLDFTFPYRSQASRSFVPAYGRDEAMGANPALSSPMSFSEDKLAPNPADATLLRRYFNGQERDTNAVPIGDFPYRPLLTPIVGDQLGQDAVGNAQFLPQRSVMEELEGLQRLSNMTTTRSNVFAVWVTVGYFEAEQVDFAAEADGDTNVANKLRAIYPDGYRYGKELGYGSGYGTEEAYRHRSFYLIDRTIPVGFRRGDTSLNVDDTIILKKSIE